MIIFDHTQEDVFNAMGTDLYEKVVPIVKKHLSTIGSTHTLSEIMENILKDLPEWGDRLMAMYIIGGFVDDLVSGGNYPAMNANQRIKIVNDRTP